MPAHMLETCPKCGRPRSQIEHFYTYNGRRERRLRSVCKPCHIAQSIATRRNRKDAYNASVRARRRSSPKALAYEIWRQARERAAKRGLEFTISREFVEASLLAGHCAVTGAKFNLNEGATRQNPLAPSLDRINPKIGYILGNCRLVTWIYNRAKGDGTDADVFAMAELINALEISKAG